MERHENPWLTFARKFWAPIPWMLEAAGVLTLLMQKQADAMIIFSLLAFNAMVSYLQEDRAGNALALLRKRLATNARVLRDGQWQQVPARDLVPGDAVHLRVGDIVPADLILSQGDLLLDQSALTGESLPSEASPPMTAYSASIVQRGEATGNVVATGAKTYFGKTAQIVQTAKTATHLEATILTIVRRLMIIDVLLVFSRPCLCLAAEDTPAGGASIRAHPPHCFGAGGPAGHVHPRPGPWRGGDGERSRPINCSNCRLWPRMPPLRIPSFWRFYRPGQGIPI